VCSLTCVDALANPESEIVSEMEGAVTKSVRRTELGGRGGRTVLLRTGQIDIQTYTHVTHSAYYSVLRLLSLPG
jgi:hypothetical protein